VRVETVKTEVSLMATKLRRVILHKLKLTTNE